MITAIRNHLCQNQLVNQVLFLKILNSSEYFIIKKKSYSKFQVNFTIMLSVAFALKLPIHAMSSFEILTHSVKLVPAHKLNFHLNRNVHKTRSNTQKSSFNSSSSTVPRLIYVQNPLSWLRNKLYLQILKFTWDRQFVESDFKRGATQVFNG